MRDDKAFERILASLHEAMLDDTLWRHTSALIDEACGITSNAIAVADGRGSDSRASSSGSTSAGSTRTV